MSSITRSLQRKIAHSKYKAPKIRSYATQHNLLEIADMWARAGINRGDTDEIVMSKLSPEVEWTMTDVHNMISMVDKYKDTFDHLYMMAKRNIAREQLEEEIRKAAETQNENQNVIEVMEGELINVAESESKETE